MKKEISSWFCLYSTFVFSSFFKIKKVLFFYISILKLEGTGGGLANNGDDKLDDSTGMH